jgi:hypothetical protein
MKKKGAMLAGGLAAALFISACSGGFTFPKRVVITGNPSYALPLGSLRLPIEEYLSVEAIGDIMDESSGIRVYDYAPGGDGLTGDGRQPQTYLIHFPIEPLEFSLDAEQFGFNKDGAVVTIPGVEIPSLDRVSNSVIIPLPGGTLSPGRELPLPEGGNFFTLIINNDNFFEAEIKEGYFVLSGGKGQALDFGKTTILLSRPGMSRPPELFPEKTGDEWRYNLAGMSLYPDTQVELLGSIAADTAINASALTIDLAPQINLLGSVRTRVTTREAQTIKVDFADSANDWIKAINFSRTGLRLRVSPRIDGLTVRVNAPELGITGQEQRFSADNFETGLEFEGANAAIGRANFDVQVEANPGRNDVLTLYDVHPKASGVSVVVRPESLFEWEDIRVNLAEMPPEQRPKLTGSFPGGDGPGFDLSGLLGIFDDPDHPRRLLFDNIPLHLFLSGPSEIIDIISFSMEARYGGTAENLTGGIYAKPAAGGSAPNFQVDAPDRVYGKALEPAHLEINLTQAFNAKADFVLSYSIQLSDRVIAISRGDIQRLEILPDLIVELPLAFRIAVDNPAEPFATLELSGLLGDSPDLFGRSPPAQDGETQEAGKSDSSPFDLADIVDTLTMDLGYTSTLSGGLRLTGFDEPKTILGANTGGDFTGRQIVEFKKKDLEYPFAPKVEIFVPVDSTDSSGGRYGLFKIMRGTKEIPLGISLSLFINLKTDINAEIDFGAM